MVDRCRVSSAPRHKKLYFFLRYCLEDTTPLNVKKGFLKLGQLYLKGFAMNRFSREKTPIDVAAYLSNTQQEPFSSLTYDVYRFLKKYNLSFFILRTKKEINDLLSH